MTPLKIKPHAKLDQQLRFERLLAEISTFFINLPADLIDGEIESAQGRVCNLLDLDRSSLFQIAETDPETVLLTHSHQPPGSRIGYLLRGLVLKNSFPGCSRQIFPK